jgi:hypothetical protein
MNSLPVRRWRVLLAAGFAFCVALTEARAQVGEVKGQTESKTATMKDVNVPPLNLNDTITVTTFAIKGLSTSAIINQGAKEEFQNGKGKNALADLVYAGVGPIGKNFTPISLSDFDVTTYQPWVVNSTAKINNVVTPDKVNHFRGVDDQDAGGVNIVIVYTPGASDPRTINFLQAYKVVSPSLPGSPIISIDNAFAPSPFFNQAGSAGINNGGKNAGNPPLVIPANTMENPSNNAWMEDIPYICETGIGGAAGHACPETAPKKGDAITDYTDTFNMFIEAPGVFDGKTYQVLYGGFEWGFTFTATVPTASPELSTYALVMMGFAALGFAGRRARRQVAAA